MTRLTSNHITKIPTTWEIYTRCLKERTGLSLFELACNTLKIDVENAHAQCMGQHVAIIPISSGEGKIEGFDIALQSIALYLGFKSTILSPDEAGFAQYHAGDFDIAIWADDDTFIAENKHTAMRAENGIATGKGFAELLHTMLDMCGETIFIRGCGPVGRNAAFHLANHGYKFFLCDKVYDTAQTLASELVAKGFQALAVTPANIHEYTKEIYAMLDAAPNPAQNDDLPVTDNTIVVAPCVPYLWKDTPKRWHDSLQLGTSVMLIAAATNSPFPLLAPF